RRAWPSGPAPRPPRHRSSRGDRHSSCAAARVRSSRPTRSTPSTYHRIVRRPSVIDDAPDPDEVIDDAVAGTFTVREHNGTLIQGHTINVYRALEVERRLPCNPIPSVDLRAALERYAPPPQLAAARDLLERT